MSCAPTEFGNNSTQNETKRHKKGKKVTVGWQPLSEPSKTYTHRLIPGMMLSKCQVETYPKRPDDPAENIRLPRHAIRPGSLYV